MFVSQKLLKLRLKLFFWILSGKVKKVNPEIISTGNIGCITQISQGTTIPILHTVEIIDWYTGGPKPNILEKI